MFLNGAISKVLSHFCTLEATEWLWSDCVTPPRSPGREGGSLRENLSKPEITIKPAFKLLRSPADSNTVSPLKVGHQTIKRYYLNIDGQKWRNRYSEQALCPKVD